MKQSHHSKVVEFGRADKPTRIEMIIKEDNIKVLEKFAMLSTIEAQATYKKILEV